MKTKSEYRFPKQHRLTHKKVIGQLFSQDKPLKRYPLLALYSPFEGPFQVGFAIPKRKIRSAVKRNRIRRKLREAFRLQNPLLQRGFEGLKVVFLYLPAAERDYSCLAEAMGELLQALREAAAAGSPSSEGEAP